MREVTARGIVVEFTKKRLTFDGAADHIGTLILSSMGAVSKFERATILERQREGIRIAQDKGCMKAAKTL